MGKGRPQERTPIWESGLKTLPTRAVRRGTNEWTATNNKTIPNERPDEKGTGGSRSRTPQPEIHRHDGWESGFKTIPEDQPTVGSARSLHRSRSLGPSSVSGTDVDSPYGSARGSGRWSVTNKTVEDPPASPHLDRAREGWMSEDRKTLTNTRKKIAPPSDPWTRTKTIKPPRRPRHAVYVPSKVDLSNNHYQSPATSDWNLESHKTLPHHSAASPKEIHRHGKWESGYKTLGRRSGEDQGGTTKKDHVAEHAASKKIDGDWVRESFKTLPEEERRGGGDRGIRLARRGNNALSVPSHEIVREGTGWDSGLYKTLHEERKHYVDEREWKGTEKRIHNSDFVKENPTSHRALHFTDDTPDLNGDYAFSPHWRPGMKTIPQQHSNTRRVRTTAGMDLSHSSTFTETPLKTLPKYESAARTYAEESREKFVEDKRRRDMEQFHRRMCTRR